MTPPIAAISDMLSKAFGRIKLGIFPTPVTPLYLFDIGITPKIWVKRDDLSSSIYGGNKIRKLEFILKETDKPVITFGPLGSHHVLATAIHARRLNKRCAAVLVPQHMTPHHQGILKEIEAICDPVIKIGRELTTVSQILETIGHAVRRGNLSYQICPPGGTSPIGTLGFVLGGLELSGQVQEGRLEPPEKVFVPLGTGGTAAGLAIGFALAGMKTETVAVRVVPRAVLPNTAINFLIARTLSVIRAVYPLAPKRNRIRLSIEDRFCGRYAEPTAAAETALALSEKADLPLETTYSAKAMAALISHIGENRNAKGPYLFWQTYSQTVPAGISVRTAGSNSNSDSN